MPLLADLIHLLFFLLVPCAVERVKRHLFSEAKPLDLNSRIGFHLAHNGRDVVLGYCAETAQVLAPLCYLLAALTLDEESKPLWDSFLEKELREVDVGKAVSWPQQSVPG